MSTDTVETATGSSNVIGTWDVETGEETTGSAAEGDRDEDTSRDNGQQR